MLESIYSILLHSISRYAVTNVISQLILEASRTLVGVAPYITRLLGNT
jgi:hypothetical protein